MIPLHPNVEIQVRVDGRRIAEHGKPFAVGLPDAQVQRSKVARVGARLAPFAAVLLRDALVVDIVLRRRRLTLPLEICRCVGTGQWLSRSTFDGKRDSLRFGAYAC